MGCLFTKADGARSGKMQRSLVVKVLWLIGLFRNVKGKSSRKTIQRSKLDMTKLKMFSILNILELMFQTMAILMFLLRIGATSLGEDFDSMPRP